MSLKAEKYKNVPKSSYIHDLHSLLIKDKHTEDRSAVMCLSTPASTSLSHSVDKSE